MRKVVMCSVLTIALLVGFAAGVMTTSPVARNTVQMVGGVVFNITGAFVLGSLSGTSLLPSAETGPPTPSSCVWEATGACTTATIAGDWLFTVTLILNKTAVPAPAGTYTITLISNAFSQTYISFSVPSTATAFSNMQFVFDLRTNTLLSATAITILVS